MEKTKYNRRTLKMIDLIISRIPEEKLKDLEISSKKHTISFKQLMIMFCGIFPPRYRKKKTLRIFEERYGSIIESMEKDESFNKILLAQKIQEGLFYFY